MNPLIPARRIVLAAGLLLGAARGLLGDTIVLNDGTRLEGTVLAETPQKIVLQQGADVKVLARGDVASVSKGGEAAAAQPGAAQAAPRQPDRAKQAAYVPANAQDDPVTNVVVKVSTTVVAPNFFRPWTRQQPRARSGSGWLLGGSRVITSAHLVLYANQVLVQANESGDKISASVVAVAPDLDLAVLKLDEKSPMDNPATVPSSAVLPDIKDSVSVYGFPDEGSNVSISTATVARIDYGTYGHRYTGLHLWLHPSANEGLSGGPVVYKNMILGVACCLKNGEATSSFIVPCEEVNEFLGSITPSGYPGKPVVSQGFQHISNPALRSFLKLDPAVHGMLVGEAEPAPDAVPFRDWDVVTQVGGEPVDDEGMVRVGSLRIGATYMVQRAVKNGTVPYRVLRDGVEVPLEVPAVANRPMLIRDLETAPPPYFILGPVVFSTASRQLLSAVDTIPRLESLLAYRGSPLVKRRLDRPSFQGEELVVISSPFFPHKLAEGYSDPSLCVVKAVNGIAVKNLLHVVQILRDSKDEFVVIEFGDRYCEDVVFPRAAMVAATESILNDNDVRSQGSGDAMAVWNAQPPR
ncbi:MAG: trypsin-like peptidase domain-containing protein [Opitutaceae bacterium]